MKTWNAGISRNMPEYHGICRNITKLIGPSFENDEFDWSLSSFL